MSPTADDPLSLRRREDDRFLRGAGRYVGDTPAAGHLLALFLRSPHPHAAILRIRPATTAAMSRVWAMFTQADLIAGRIRPLPCAMALPPQAALVVPPRQALAAGRVRHVGQCVALIVADTAAAARNALETIEVHYDDLPAVTLLGDALADGAPQIWAEAAGNLAFHYERGECTAVKAAFAAPAQPIGIGLVNNRVAAAALEPHTAIAEYDMDGGVLRLILSGQDVHGIRRDLAHCFGVAPKTIHVLCPDVGGGFGMKNVLYPEYVTLLCAACRLGRPVRWAADRTEGVLSGVHGRDSLTRARLALDGHGRFLALHVETTANLGAYVSSLGPGAHTTAPASAMGGLYAIPAVFMDVRGTFTNTAPVDAYRGAGKPEASYIVERLADLAAQQSGRDRVALRHANLIQAFSYTSALGIAMDTGRFRENLEEPLLAADHAGFVARRAEAARGGRLLGQGIACFLETSRGQPGEDGAVRFLSDGTVALLFGT